MAQRIRAFDWAATSLGQIEHWPQSLKTVLDLILAMPGPATLLWGPSDIQLYNDAYVTIAQDRHPGQLGRPVAEGWPDAYEAAILPVLRTARAGRSTRLTGLLVPLRSSDGQIKERYFDTDISPVRDEAGAVAGSLLILKEITEHKLAEAALRESEAQLGLFVEHAPAAIAMFDREMRYLAYSRRFLTDLRLTTADSIIGRSHYEIFPEIPQRWRDIHARVLAGETLSEEEDPFPRPDGRTDWLRWTMTPWRTAEGAIGGALIFSEVTTEQVEARRALAASEERLRMALDAASAGTWEATPETGEFIASTRALVMHGLSPGTPMTHDKALAAIHPEDRPRVEEALRHTLKTGDRFEIEVRSPQPDGSTRWLLSQAELRRNSTLPRLVGLVQDITERMQAEFELERLRDMLTEGQRIAQAGSWEYFAATQETIWSDEEKRIFGLDPAEPSPVYEEMLRHHIHPEDAAEVDRRFSEALERNAEFENESRIVLSDGSVRWIHNRARPYFDADGKLIKYIGATLDITERKKAEEKLRASEERHRTLVRATSTVTWSCPATGLQVEPQPEWMAFTGQSLQDMLGNGWTKAVHPDDVAMAVSKWQDAVDRRVPFENEHRIRRHDGDWRWMHVRAAPLDGEKAAWIGMCTDITDRKRAEIALRAAHDTFRHLVDRSPFGIYTADADFRLAQVSDGAQKVFENVRPLIGRDLAEVLRTIWPEPFATEVIEHFRRTLDTGEPYRAPSTVEQRADIDATEAYDWKLERVTLPDGRPGVVCHFYDLSERQRHEEHVQLLMREINHRAKNMLGLVQSVARQTASTGAADFIQRFEQRVQSLAAAQDLLVKNEWRAVPLEDLVRSQLAHFADLIDTRVVTAGPPLSLAPSAAQALAMALHELATNAAKYGALSNDSGIVKVAWSLVGDGAERRFAMSWIEQGGPPVAKPERCGFGSTVTTDMIRMSFEGEVSVDYASSGLVWRIVCPAANLIEAHSSLVFERRQRRPAAVVSEQSRPRLLIVEDEPLIAAEMAAVLTDGGFEVIGPAGNVNQALALLQVRGCDAAVLDVNLGKETSEPVAKELLATGKPFVVVSGYAREQLPELMRAAPFAAKPLRQAVLESQVKLCLKSIAR